MVFLYWNISILLSFCCVFLSAPGDTEMLPPPMNAVLVWNKEFCPTLKWTKPNISDISDKCVVNYTVSKSRGSGEPQPKKTSGTSLLYPCESREEDISFTIKTVPGPNCSGLTDSRPINISLPRLTDIVKGFTCAYYASESLNCSWHPNDQHADLRSYYSFSQDSNVMELHPCPHNLYNGSRLIGCHLKRSLVRANHSVYFLINASSGHDSIYSTYHRDIKMIYGPPPPVVSVSLLGDEGARPQLKISWSPPNFPPNQQHCFRYELHYNACGEHKAANHSGTSVSVSYNPKCKYRVWVKTFVHVCGSGESLPSQVEIYGQDSSDAALVLVAVGVCVFLVLCTLLICFFYKYKEKLLPKIPEPRLDRSIRGLMERLYVPVSEDVEGNLEVCVDTRQPMLALSHLGSNTHSGSGSTQSGSGNTHSESGNTHTANSPQHTGSGDTHTANSPQHTGNSSDTHSHTSNSINTSSGTTHTCNGIHAHTATETHTPSDTHTENNTNSANSIHTCKNTTHTDSSTTHTDNNTHTDRDTQDNSGIHTGAHTHTDDNTHAVEECLVDMDYSSVTRR